MSILYCKPLYCYGTVAICHLTCGTLPPMADCSASRVRKIANLLELLGSRASAGRQKNFFVVRSLLSVTM